MKQNIVPGMMDDSHIHNDFSKVEEPGLQHLVKGNFQGRNEEHKTAPLRVVFKTTAE